MVSPSYTWRIGLFPMDLDSAGHLPAEELSTTEMDTSLVLAPDGAGGVEFRAETGGGGGGALDDLSDVVITSPAAGDRLRFNGTNWVNTDLIWRPVMAFDGTNWLVVVDGSGNAVMAEG